MITFDAQCTLDSDGDIHLDFDHVYRIDARGMITDQHADGRPWDYAPDVSHSDEHDVDIMRTSIHSGEWQVLTGNTGQYGYNGAVMHPSELWSQCHIDDLKRLADRPDSDLLLFCITEVRDDDGHLNDADPIGWVVAYQEV